MSLFFGVLCILIQGLFSATETALISANPIRLIHWLKEGKGKVQRGLDLLKRKEEGLVFLLIGINIMVVLSSMLFTKFFVDRLGPGGATLAIIINLSLSLILGEFIPKSYSVVASESIMLKIGPIFYTLLSPLHPLFGRLNFLVSKPRPPFSRSDFIAAIREATKRERLPRRLGGIVANLFSFSKTSIREIMVPLSQVVAIPRENLYSCIKDAVEKYGYSRYPIYDGQKENIIGIAHIKDFLLDEHPIPRIPFFIELNESPMRVLKLMKNRGVGMALVKDKRGRTVGLITLEDLLEELIGEIRSEE